VGIEDIVLGETYDWKHGDNYRIGQPIEFSYNKKKVLISGSSGALYWMRTDTFIKKINEPEKTSNGLSMGAYC